MGHRANFVLVSADGWRLYRAKSAANGIIDYLAAGPGAATRFVEVQDEVRDREDDGWYSEVDAEGGAVVDLIRRRLLFYGNDLLNELPCKRAALALLDRLPPPLPRSHVCAHIPAQGLYVEVASGLVGYWTTSAVFDLTGRTTRQWTGWRVELWGDRVEEQVARCGDVVRIPDLDPGAAHRRLTAALEREREYSLDWLNRTHAEERDDPWFMSYLVALGDDANWARVTAGLAAIRHRPVE